MLRTFFPPPENRRSSDGVKLLGRAEKRLMLRQTTYYRGYRIEGESDDRSWLLRIGPRRPALPILRFASFRVKHPTWSEALAEAGQRIDAVLAGGEVARDRARPYNTRSRDYH